MNKFARWSGIVRSNLSQFHPKHKLGHAQEILAAAFGHRTYASFRAHDLAVLKHEAKYLLLNDEMALSRAADLGVPLTPEEWREAVKSLTPSEVSGESWIIYEQSMQAAARIAFEDTSHERITEIQRSIGMPDGRQAGSTHCLSMAGDLPEELRFVVEGELRAFNDESSLAVPVTSEIAFRRVGKRFYDRPRMLSVAQSGQPHEYEPEFEFESYGMSED